MRTKTTFLLLIFFELLSLKKDLYVCNHKIDLNQSVALFDKKFNSLILLRSILKKEESDNVTNNLEQLGKDYSSLSLDQVLNYSLSSNLFNVLCARSSVFDYDRRKYGNILGNLVQNQNAFAFSSSEGVFVFNKDYLTKPIAYLDNELGMFVNGFTENKLILSSLDRKVGKGKIYLWDFKKNLLKYIFDFSSKNQMPKVVFSQNNIVFGVSNEVGIFDLNLNQIVYKFDSNKKVLDFLLLEDQKIIIGCEDQNLFVLDYNKDNSLSINQLNKKSDNNFIRLKKLNNNKILIMTYNYGKKTLIFNILDESFNLVFNKELVGFDCPKDICVHNDKLLICYKKIIIIDLDSFEKIGTLNFNAQSLLVFNDKIILSEIPNFPFWKSIRSIDLLSTLQKTIIKNLKEKDDFYKDEKSIQVNLRGFLKFLSLI